MPAQSVITEMQVLEALKRRGVAMAVSDISTWEVHERYLQSLFIHLRTEPPEYTNARLYNESCGPTGKCSWR